MCPRPPSGGRIRVGVNADHSMHFALQGPGGGAEGKHPKDDLHGGTPFFAGAGLAGKGEAPLRLGERGIRRAANAPDSAA